MSPPDALREAARWLENHEWQQKEMILNRHGYLYAACAYGAIVLVTDCRLETLAAAERLCRHLGLAGRNGQPGLEIGAWNDRPGQTKTEVIAALRKAAEP